MARLVRKKKSKVRSVSKEDMGSVEVDVSGDLEASRVSSEDIPPDCQGGQAMNDFLIIWPARPPKKIGNLIVPEGVRAAEASRDEGEVLAVGPEIKNDIRVGDYVYYWKHAGSWQAAPSNSMKNVRVIKDSEVYFIRSREL